MREVFRPSEARVKTLTIRKNLRTCAERYLMIQLCQKSKYKCQSVHKIDFMHAVSLKLKKKSFCTFFIRLFWSSRLYKSSAQKKIFWQRVWIRRVKIHMKNRTTYIGKSFLYSSVFQPLAYRWKTALSAAHGTKLLNSNRVPLRLLSFYLIWIN